MFTDKSNADFEGAKMKGQNVFTKLNMNRNVTGIVHNALHFAEDCFLIDIQSIHGKLYHYFH